MDNKEIKKIVIDNVDYYLAYEIAKIWGHSNLKQKISRELDESDYITIGIKENNSIFQNLYKNYNLSNKTRKVILVNDKGVLKLALYSKSEKAKYFLEKLTTQILNAKEAAGVDAEFFIRMISNAYSSEKELYKTYIIVNEDNYTYKIGCSKTPKIRESTLQSQEPNCKILLILDKNIERELHSKYKEKRIRGEWFNLNVTDLVELIEVYGFESYKESSPF